MSAVTLMSEPCFTTVFRRNKKTPTPPPPPPPPNVMSDSEFEEDEIVAGSSEDDVRMGQMGNVGVQMGSKSEATCTHSIIYD